MDSQDTSFKNVELKSTAFLIDEFITLSMRIENETKKLGGIKPKEMQERAMRLDRVIQKRITGRLTPDKYKDYVETVFLLSRVLRECWNAQEVFINWREKTEKELATAGVIAQETNANRNMLWRTIDILLNEELTEGKTYSA